MAALKFFSFDINFDNFRIAGDLEGCNVFFAIFIVLYLQIGLVHKENFIFKNFHNMATSISKYDFFYS